MTTEPSRPESATAITWRLSALASGLVSIAALAAFLALDRRPPADLGHYFAALPTAWEALEPGGSITAAGALLLDHGGLYNLPLAAWMKLVGRGPLALRAVEFPWLGALLLGCYGSARALAGERVAAMAMGLLGAMPVFQFGARAHWTDTFPPTRPRSLTERCGGLNVVAWGGIEPPTPRV